jgi:dTDP-4-dehydrorhamnose 3,5-epimerase
MKLGVTKTLMEKLTFQTYTPKPTIHGVTVTPLNPHHDINGTFLEFARISDHSLEHHPLSPKQINISTIAPNRINAFHLHPLDIQNELWSVIHGVLRVWLVDVRSGSPTEGVRQMVILSGVKPTHLFIPWGIAHGYQTGTSGATLVYVTDVQFSLKMPNEGRLPWDTFGAELWNEDRG